MHSQGKPLFPSASRQKTRVPNSEALSLPSSSGRLDWLENKSFNTEDAIVIAKIHSSRETECYENNDNDETDESLVTSEKRPHAISVEEPEKRQKHSDSQTRKPHKHGHKHKHKKLSSKYNSDSDDSQRKYHYDHKHSKKKSKHRKHKHESRSHRSKNKGGRSSSSSGDDKEEYKDDDILENRSIHPTWLDDLRQGGDTEMFYVDKKRDKNNLCFDSLHFTDTAFYKRLGKACLGLTGKVQWSQQSKKKTTGSDLRYFGRGRVKVTDDVEVVLPLGRADTQQAGSSNTPMQSFISLGTVSNKLSPSEVDPLGVLDASTRQYLGDHPSGQDTQSVEQQSEIKPPQTNPVAEFNRYLHENPHDIDKWLEFVKFQDTSEGIQALTVDSTETEKKKKHKIYIAEKKQAILEKALKRNPNNLELQLAQLELCRESWTDAQQIQEWEKVLKSHPDNIALWKEYILFNQSAFSLFSLTKAVSLYEKCFEALLSVEDGQHNEDGSSLTVELMDLFVQQCHLWRQAGHTEKAVAAFQAMVELNCFCPEHLEENMPIKGQIAFLETFWDSGEPHFGEKDAKGWKTWMTKKEKGGWQQLATQDAGDGDDDDDAQALDNTKPVWQAWLQEETHREQTHILPWRPDASKGETEEDCEDPERMVLFDDISGVLFKLQSQPEKYNLICNFVEFIGVNTSCTSATTRSSVNKGCHLSLEHPKQLSLNVTSSGIWQPADNDDVTGWQHQGNGVAFNCESLNTRTKVYCKELKSFITDIFTQSLDLFDEPARTNLLVIWLKHELSFVSQQGTAKQQKKQAKAARKFAKKLLSEEKNRNNVLLWEVFAKWEWSLGNKQDACKMLDMGLSFAKQAKDANQRRTLAQVVSTYTELLCDGHDDVNPSKSHADSTGASLHILTNHVESGPYVPFKESSPIVPSVAIIRARKAYQEMLDSAMKEDKSRIVSHEWLAPSGSCIVHIARCYARFQYLTLGMQAASVVMEETLDFLRRNLQLNRNAIHRIQQKLDSELVLTSYTKLLAQHVLNNPTPLSILRNLLRRALTEFPDNVAFLQLFISVEAKSHIAGRVRRYIDQATQESKTPVPWLCAISAEKQRQQMITSKTDIPGATSSVPETGISNRIRSIFDRAVSHKASRHCILLWRLYMQFEVQQGNVKRAQAIFYQALQHCPWAKVLYVDAVRLFPEKLQDFHDLLMEKELRIRAPVEEIELLMNG